MQLSTNHKVLATKTFIHLTSLAFLTWQYYLAITDQLGGDPVQAIIHFTGIGAFNLLLLSLLVSPFAKKFRLAWLMRLRRLLGLYAFTYALLHVLNFFTFDLQLDFPLFLNELIERPYINVGLVAFIILLPLAVTSISAIQRKMGKSWQTLHSFIYLAVVLVAIHFYWSVKSELIEPIIYLLVTFILLSVRKDRIKRWIGSFIK